MQNAAKYASTLLSRFEARAGFAGIELAPVQLVHGDFMRSFEVITAIRAAGLIFMNNPTFGDELNQSVLSKSSASACVSMCFISFEQVGCAPSCQRAASL